MINMLMIIPNQNDATSLYRAHGPFSELRKTFDFNSVFADRMTDSTLDWVDMVFMQRPFTDEHKLCAEMVKENGKPLWVDYDDLLFDLPKDNPNYRAYMNPRSKRNLAEIIAMADVVTVSTEQLKRCIQLPRAPLNQRVYVIPNAMPDKFIPLARPYNAKKHVNWRGSNTHQRDIAEFGEEIISLAQENPDMSYTFIGYDPWMVTQFIRDKQAIVVEPMHITKYFKVSAKMNPSIQIVPLHDHMFNRCKSNIAWIEALYSGAVCVAPNWEEWKDKPGCLNYAHAGEFKSCVQYALNNPEEMEAKHAEGWKYILENLKLSQVNKKRIELMAAMNLLSKTGEYEFPEGGAPIQEEVLELE